jgi:hypothetical protein
VTQDDISLLRPADLALDGSSNLYVASLAGGRFDNTDTVAPSQVRPPTTTPSHGACRRPTLCCSGSSRGNTAPSARPAGAARRGRPAVSPRCAAIANEQGRRSATAIFTLKQLRTARTTCWCASPFGRCTVRETALRALADRATSCRASRPRFVKALPTRSRRSVRRSGSVRLGRGDAASSLVPLTGSADQGFRIRRKRTRVAGRSDAASPGSTRPAVRAGDGAPRCNRSLYTD